MNDEKDRRRVAWTARISVQPSVRDAINRLAKDEMVPTAHMIGTALAFYVTSRST
jgi:DNA-binding FadR family transcriptional regulator